MNDRPSRAERQLAAWLEEGPTSGPDDVLVAAHARARSTRQRPTWWLRLRGTTMESTWRARPLPGIGRLGLAILLTLLLAALVGAGLIAGSRLLSGPTSDLNAVPPAIPKGDAALFAFTSWGGDSSLRGDLYVARADGTDVRRVTADAFDDWSPAWSPDGGRIAFYSGDDDSVQLRVAEPDGSITKLADAPGCWNPTSEPPAWSPDGRFIAFIADRDAIDQVCDVAFADVWVVASDGSGEPHRLFADDVTLYSSDPAWHGHRIAVRGADETTGGLYVVDVTDPAAPWGLTPVRVDGTKNADPVAFGGSRWSPDGSLLASTAATAGVPFGMGTLYDPAKAGDPGVPLWASRDTDAIAPDWSPDGTWLTLLVLHAQLSDHGVYHLAMVPVDGSAPTTLDTIDLSGNAGSARVSPDGTRLLVRAPSGAMPGDVLVLTTTGEQKLDLHAGQWSSMDWQPVVNPDNPAATAPAGRPQL